MISFFMDFFALFGAVLYYDIHPSDIPDIPEIPEIPENPIEIPEIPENPIEIPDIPENPIEKSKPILPKILGLILIIILVSGGSN
jgi:hypothetical protein